MILILHLQGYSVQVHITESFKDTGKELKLDLILQKKDYQFIDISLLTLYF